MKKLLSILLVLALAFSLVACKGSAPADTAGETKGETKEEASDEIGMIKVSGTDLSVRPDAAEVLTVDKLQEVVNYFYKHTAELENKSYEEIAQYFGTAGVYFEDMDQDQVDGVLKFVRWFAEDDYGMQVVFLASNKDPDKFIFNMWTSSLTHNEE